MTAPALRHPESFGVASWTSRALTHSFAAPFVEKVRVSLTLQVSPAHLVTFWGHLPAKNAHEAVELTAAPTRS